ISTDLLYCYAKPADPHSFPTRRSSDLTGLKLDDVTWESMDPPLREPMLVRGDVDAITGHYFTSILNLEAQGVSKDDLTVFKYFRSEEHTSELQSRENLVCRLLLEKKKQ